VCEREDVNRTRVAGSRDEVEGVVANTLNLFRNGPVGFIDWLDVLRGTNLPNKKDKENDKPDIPNKDTPAQT